MKLNKKRILSIIIPTYQCSNYLSLLLPQFIHEELINKIEVLIVDDGSTDDTRAVAQNYVSKFPKLFSYHYKKNGGHGSVINYAVYNLVNCKYFKVVDADDNINSVELIKFVNFLYRIDFPIIVTDFTKNTNGNIEIIKYDGENRKRLIDKFFCIHMVTYKTDFWKRNKIYVTENAFYEDQQYILFPLAFTSTIKYIKVNFYIHNELCRETQSTDPKMYLKHIGDIQKILDDSLKFYYSLSKISPDFKSVFVHRCKIDLFDYPIEFAMQNIKSPFKRYTFASSYYKKYKNCFFNSQLNPKLRCLDNFYLYTKEIIKTKLIKMFSKFKKK